MFAEVVSLIPIALRLGRQPGVVSQVVSKDRCMYMSVANISQISGNRDRRQSR